MGLETHFDGRISALWLDWLSLKKLVGGWEGTPKKTSSCCIVLKRYHFCRTNSKWFRGCFINTRIWSNSGNDSQIPETHTYLFFELAEVFFLYLRLRCTAIKVAVGKHTHKSESRIFPSWAVGLIAERSEVRPDESYAGLWSAVPVWYFLYYAPYLKSQSCSFGNARPGLYVSCLFIY